MPRYIDPVEAEEVMLAAGLLVLEPYPGNNKPWRCICLTCGREVAPRRSNVYTRGRGCKHCAPNAPVDPELARAAMRTALLEPLVPFETAHTPWACRCVQCGAVTSPRLSNIRSGFGGCAPCANKRNALAQRGDPEQAEADMLAAQLRPLVPYPGVNDPWRSECLRCGDEVNPRLGHVRQGHGGCFRCGRARTAAAQLGDAVHAAAEMEAAGLQPLETYPGYNNPWRCIHRACGQEVRARLASIRAGQGGCTHCATHGFNLSAPAVVYVLHHVGFGVVKVGITAAISDRVARFEKRGFAVVGLLPVPTGQQAWDVERAVLRHVRVDLGLTHSLSQADLHGVGGWTETFSAKELPPWNLWSLVQRFHKETVRVPGNGAAGRGQAGALLST